MRWWFGRWGRNLTVGEFREGLGQTLAIFHHIGTVMTANVEDLKRIVNETRTEVEALHGKLGALIQLQRDTLQSLNDLKATGGATQAELQALVDTAQSTLDTIHQEETEADGALTPPAETPPAETPPTGEATGS